MDRMLDCFVIAPIGDPGSDTRRRTDQLVDHVIEKAAKDHYNVTIAHEIDEPGKITVQVVEKIINSALVVADLTDGNANVFYELSLRHVLNEPALLLIREDQLSNVPFDVHGIRITPYNLQDLDSVNQTVEALREQMNAIAQDHHIGADTTPHEVSVLSEPKGPSNNVVLLGTLMIANRFRYELVEPFFETLYDFDKRLANLHNAFRSVMRESARKKYLRRETILTAFTNKDLRRKVADLFDEVERIIPALIGAMNDRDEEKIKKALAWWRVNNANYFRAWSQQYGEWIEEELPAIDVNRRK